jgi:hypothetical protein
MRRALVAAVGMIGLAITLGLSASAVAAPKVATKRAFFLGLRGSVWSG